MGCSPDTCAPAALRRLWHAHRRRTGIGLADQATNADDALPGALLSDALQLYRGVNTPIAPSAATLITSV